MVPFLLNIYCVLWDYSKGVLNLKFSIWGQGQQGRHLDCSEYACTVYEEYNAVDENDANYIHHFRQKKYCN